jgi:hypothetical protein
MESRARPERYTSRERRAAMPDDESQVEPSTLPVAVLVRLTDRTKAVRPSDERIRRVRAAVATSPFATNQD